MKITKPNKLRCLKCMAQKLLDKVLNYTNFFSYFCRNHDYLTQQKLKKTILEIRPPDLTSFFVEFRPALQVQKQQ